MSAAKTIKKIRLSLYLKQTELAKKLGITQSALSNYESGFRRPNLVVVKKLKQLADKQGIKVKLEDFFD